MLRIKFEMVSFILPYIEQPLELPDVMALGHRINWVPMVFPDVLLFPSSISGPPLLSSAKPVLGTLFTASGFARCHGTKQGW